MDTTINKPKTSRGTLGPVQWFFQAISGVFLVFFLGVHLYLAHINFGHPIAFYREVLVNLHNPAWLIFYVVFVWIITYHALNGVKGMVYDLGLKPKTKKYVAYIITAIYIATVIYGTILAIVVSHMPIPPV